MVSKNVFNFLIRKKGLKKLRRGRIEYKFIVGIVSRLDKEKVG
ncbi:DUF3977 family protein [Bacillus paranthracis]